MSNNRTLEPRDETKKKMQPISRDTFHKLLKKAATTIVTADRSEDSNEDITERPRQLAEALRKSLESKPQRKTRKRKSA